MCDIHVGGRITHLGSSFYLMASDHEVDGMSTIEVHVAL